MPTRGRLAALGWGLAGVMEHQIVTFRREGGNRGWEETNPEKAWVPESKIPEYNRAVEGKRPHGYPDQRLRGFNVRAIVCGIGGLDEGRHDKPAEAANHET